QLLEPAHLVPANGLMGTAESLVMGIGAAAGGALVAVAGPGSTLLAGAGTFAVSALLLVGIRGIPAACSREEREPFVRELADGWREVRSRRWIWYTLASATGFLLLFEGPMQVTV